MSYKVTVIIPTYNSVEFLDSTINSIINQTFGFENIELIIIDDYSTDKTQELIDSYCDKYNNIKTFPSGKKTGTPGRARNIAINNANSDYIMFIDHDDNYVPDTVEKLYNAVTTNSCDVAIGKYEAVGSRNFITEDWIKEDTVLNSIDENLQFFSINNIWRMIFPKEFLNQNNIRFPEGVFAEDLTFMVDAFINAKKIVFINEVVYKFRFRTGEDSSTSLSKGMHYLNGLIEGYDYTFNVLNKNNALKYYDIIFNQHLSVWLNDVCLSDVIEFDDKKELIKKSIHLFKQINNINPFPENDPIKSIMIQIKNENLNDVYTQMKSYKKFNDKIINLETTLNKKNKKIRSLEKKLNKKDKENAILKENKGLIKKFKKKFIK